MSAAGHSATPTLADPGMIKDHDGKPCRYLTDGVNLYRYVGTIPGSMGRMIGLENCTRWISSSGRSPSCTR